jgi:two-component system OmpR family response regulator
VSSQTEDFLQTEHFKISKNTREVLVDGVPITNLTPKEFDLLYYMVEHPRQVFSREQLLERVWGYQFYGDERTVDVHIKRLRKKVETASQPFFHTIWGVGYKFDESIQTDKN